jgi:hypothetical protein
MKDIEPGKYRLTVNRNGYVTLTYGARGPMRLGTTLSLIRQQHMTDLALKLTPHAVITGRILDEEREQLHVAACEAGGFQLCLVRKCIGRRSWFKPLVARVSRMLGVRGDRRSVSLHGDGGNEAGT